VACDFAILPQRSVTEVGAVEGNSVELVSVVAESRDNERPPDFVATQLGERSGLQRHDLARGEQRDTPRPDFASLSDVEPRNLPRRQFAISLKKEPLFAVEQGEGVLPAASSRLSGDALTLAERNVRTTQIEASFENAVLIDLVTSPQLLDKEEFGRE